MTPGASDDGTAMIAYNADSVTLMGQCYHYPAANHDNTTMRQVYDWDSGVYLGEIPEARQTYNVVGNINEHGLCIGETTFGGVQVLAHQPGAIIDYGSLIYITLQRSKTAREAIHTMIHLMDTYGYASEGESFSIADRSGQVWMMEVIGRGDTYGKLGAVYVAQRIPDGMVAAHANQARIQRFERDDPESCIYAPDVVDVAVHYNLYPANADPLDFSFSDTFDPVDFTTARFGDARVWSIFSKIAPQGFEEQYQDYASGENLANRMPLYIKPSMKVSLVKVMELMTSHYEGTDLDASVDVGAGLFGSPDRPRPLVWEHEGKTYHNERPVATVRTGWSFVAKLRSNVPRELSAVMWFAVDDSSTSPRVPIYGSSTRLSKAYAGKGSQDGVPSAILDFDFDKAFWVQNMVSNFCYYRWSDAYPFVRARIDVIQAEFLEEVQLVDAHALQLYKDKGSRAAVEYVTA